MPSIATLVSDAPPGEIDAVRRDIEVLSGSSNAVVKQLDAETEKANIEQLRIVKVAGKLTVVSKHNRISGSEFFTQGKTPQKFKVNHSTRETEVIGSHSVPEGHKDLAALQIQANNYLKQHYSSESVACVFPLDDDSDKYAIVVVGRKLSPQNFHNGQITAEYVLQGTKLKGTIKADIHYFEEGNVRLKSSKIANTEVSSADQLASVLVTLESEFESALNKTLVGLNEREFKALRRQLPVTRQPMVWGKAVAGYKLGKELENR